MADIDLSKTLMFGGVQKIRLTPYNKDTGLPGTSSYVLDNIVADSTTITQEENTPNAIEAETKDEPLFENITLGNYTFSASSGDIQPLILTEIFGFTKTTDSTNDLYMAPTTYAAKWCKIEVEFKDGSIVCPKVKLSCRVNASSLKTGIVQGEITGTCYAGMVGNNKDIMSPLYVSVPTPKTGS